VGLMLAPQPAVHFRVRAFRRRANQAPRPARPNPRNGGKGLVSLGSHLALYRCVWEHLQLLLAARGPPKTSSEPQRGRGLVFRTSRISLSAGRRACKAKPAAKPAISGVLLVHNGFVWPERTRDLGSQKAAESETWRAEEAYWAQTLTGSGLDLGPETERGHEAAHGAPYMSRLHEVM
jgi:hypothetical protein